MSNKTDNTKTNNKLNSNINVAKFKLWTKKFWHFIYEDESIWSWLANLVLAFILIKFIVYPFLGFVLGTSYPVVAVVSGSMEHKVAPNPYGDGFDICGNTNFNEKSSVDFDTYWTLCGSWYEGMGLSKTMFYDFPFRNGFNTGDIMVLYSKKNIKVGDVIVFWSGRSDPIIHRVVRISKDSAGNNIYQTKGDHNSRSNSDELETSEDRVIGKSLFRIPFLGWIKIIFIKAISFLKP